MASILCWHWARLLTILGLIENGLDIYWKLKTNDALKVAKGTNIPRAKHRHLVDTSVENGQIKEILVKGLSL